MFRQGPSTKRERETLLLLREALPEYEINPHMRLANVVKGRLSYKMAMGQYELDFVIQNPISGEVICAIELDDSTHDTEDGRRRDGNKNCWMAQAKIKLIRIRVPEDALTIRERMKQPIDLNIPDEIVHSFEKKSPLNSGARKIQATIFSILLLVLIMWGLNTALKGVLNYMDKFNNIGKNVAARQQQFQQQTAAQQKAAAEASWKKQQEIEQAEARRRAEAQQPHYERMLVKGKSARECSNGNVINNDSILCMKDHYEMVSVSGNQ